MKIEPFSTTCTTNDINSYEFKYDDSKSYDDNINNYINTMDEYSRNKFEINRQKSYKLTYMTCIIYSVIAFTIIFVSALTDWGNNLFYNELYLFTMTFVVGSIIIISILVYKVYSFDFPDLTKKITNDAYYCPDYWISKTINPTDYNINIDEGGSNVKIENFFGNNNYSHFNIECSLSGIYNMNMLYNNKELQAYYDYKIGVVNGNQDVLFIELYLSSDEPTTEKLKRRSGLNLDMEYFKFCQIAATMSGYTLENTDYGYKIEKNNVNALKNKSDSSYYNSIPTNVKVPLICSRIYPLFMAHEDVKYANENKIYNTTKFRCAFSRLTGIPWSQIGCK